MSSEALKLCKLRKKSHKVFLFVFFLNRGYKQVYGHLRIKEADLVKEIQKQGYRFGNFGSEAIEKRKDTKALALSMRRC